MKIIIRAALTGAVLGVVLFAYWRGTLFVVQNEIGSMIQLQLPEISRDLLVSNLASIERRLDTIRDFGGRNIKLQIDGDSEPFVDFSCLINAAYPIRVDGLQVGNVRHCVELGQLPLIILRISAAVILFFAVVIVGILAWVFRFSVLVHRRERERDREVVLLARQVSHDIRSPLAALNLAAGLAGSMPEDKRVLVRNATSRINDIANQLLQYRRTSAKRNGSRLSPGHSRIESRLLSSIVDSIVSEVRFRFALQGQLKIQLNLTESYGLFSNVEEVSFSRALSNILNNACKAVAGDSGLIEVRLKNESEFNIIEIEDNGVGIPRQLLNRVTEEGYSGWRESGAVPDLEESNQSGSGLGLYQAKIAIEAMGGQLHISSEERRGTIVSIKLPSLKAPFWFVDRISMDPNSILISVDDDSSIHEVWKSRVPESVRLENLSSPEEFERWILLSGKKVDRSKLVVLMDYEFLHGSENGIAAFRRLGPFGQMILVSSRAEEVAITNECDKLGIRVLPKSVANLVPIEIKSQFRKPTTVLIDDDPLVRLTWQAAYKETEEALLCFRGGEDFVESSAELDRLTKVYIDVDLGRGQSGLKWGEKIHGLGFSDIYLATGHDLETSEIPSFVRGVVGKSPVVS